MAAILVWGILTGNGVVSANEPGDQQPAFTLEELFGGYELDPAVLTNLDVSAISEVTGVDERELDQLRRDLQEAWQGEYIIEVEPLRQLVLAALPVVDEVASWRPYADWLRIWLDTVEDAHELNLDIPSPDLKLVSPRDLSRRPVPGRLTLAPPAVEKRVERDNPIHPWPARAVAYVPRLKSVFAAEGVPPELVWIADVESRFNPLARSRVGAAGLFQFMPQTAFLMGLQTQPRDERLDPEKSARACAAYLKYLYGKFGDWPLAVAAYNGGEGRVRRLLAETAGEKTFERIARRLPLETRQYVPKVEATILMYEGVGLDALRPVW